MIQRAYIGKICFGAAQTESGHRVLVHGKIVNIKIRGGSFRCLLALEGKYEGEHCSLFDYDLFNTADEAKAFIGKHNHHKSEVSEMDMDMNEYQAKALRTANLDKMDKSEALLNAALGLNGEAGEIADMLKKATFQGHELDQNAIEKEVGDVLWYCALAAASLGTSLAAIADKNIRKLMARYPNGFDAERSIHREGEK